MKELPRNNRELIRDARNHNSDSGRNISPVGVEETHKKTVS